MRSRLLLSVAAAGLALAACGCSDMKDDRPVAGEAREPWRLDPDERFRCDDVDIRRLVEQQAEHASVEGGVMSTPDELRAAGRPAAAVAEAERQWRALAPDLRFARLCAAIEQGLDRD